MQQTDILIIGAGPAGTYLAAKLADAKISTIIIEKKKEIGKHACSGLVSARITEYIDLDSKIIEHRIKGATFNSKNTQATIKKHKTAAYVLNRPLFDKFLAEKAIKAGAKIMTETTLKSCKIKGNKIQAETSKGTIEAKIIVGCDGAGSKTRKLANCGTPKNTVNGIIGYTDKKNSSDLVDLFYSKDTAPGFFAWKIPRGNRTEYGLASKKNHIKYFNKFTRHQKAGITESHAHPICFGILKNTTSDHIILLGDAALQVKPFSGGGIIYSFLCAGIAEKVIRKALKKDRYDNDILKQYDKEWKSKLKDKIEIGLGIRKTLDNLSDTELDTFFSIIAKDSSSIERAGDMDFL